MTKPVKMKLEFWRGNSEPLEFRLEDKAGNPFDLTGYEVEMRIQHDGGILRKRMSDGSMTSPDRTLGVVKTSFTASETRNLVMDRQPGNWELEISKDDYQRTLVTGEVTIDGGNNGD